MQTNKRVKTAAPRTFNGAVTLRTTAEQQLRRAALACMLFEGTFYESGEDIAKRIVELVRKVSPSVAQSIAIEARSEYNLRHAPLLMAVAMAETPKHRAAVRKTLFEVIQRADELAEALSIYWKGGKRPIPNQFKRGLADAFGKFDAYALGKYKSEGKGVSLRDVLFLVHAKPVSDEQAALWKSFVDGTLESPDTWEVALSAGKDKAKTFVRLMQEGKLGALATLRNLRLMVQSGVSPDAIKDYLLSLDVKRVLPYRFYVAARIMPQFEHELETLMLRSLAEKEKLPGKTLILVDTSGSMHTTMSDKSGVSRQDAASALAVLGRELCDDVRVFAFGSGVAEVPARSGMALVDAIAKVGAPFGNDTLIGNAVRAATSAGEYDRVIVVTDGQSSDKVCALPDGKRGYIINIAPYKNGVGYGRWSNIDGFSAAVYDWILEFERADA